MPDEDPEKQYAKGPRLEAPDRGKGLAEMFREMEIGDTQKKKTNEPPA